MGLYSTINCEYKLPQPLIPLGYPGTKSFQTKDFNEDMRNYTISEDGKLSYMEYESEYIEGDPNGKTVLDRIGQIRTIKEWKVDSNYTGVIEMYDFIASETEDHDFWISYLITFVGGKVTDAVMLEFETNGNASRKENEKRWKKEMEEHHLFIQTFQYRYFYKHYNWLVSKICHILRKAVRVFSRFESFLWRIENKLKI